MLVLAIYIIKKWLAIAELEISADRNKKTGRYLLVYTRFTLQANDIVCFNKFYFF